MDYNTLLTALVTNGIGVVCAAAVLWFAYYRETKTIPAMVATFSTAQTQQQTAFSLALTEQQRSFEARNEKTLDTFVQMAREERQTCQRWHEENRGDLKQVLTETKENRHSIHDIAYALGLRKEVDEALKKRQEAKRAGEKDC